MTIADDIQRLQQLHQSGALTDAEFAQAKAKALAGEPSVKAIPALNQFRRSKSDRWLGGICGGLAPYTGLESWVWRLIFVVFLLSFGVGLIAYILAWILIPEADD